MERYKRSAGSRLEITLLKDEWLESIIAFIILPMPRKTVALQIIAGHHFQRQYISIYVCSFRLGSNKILDGEALHYHQHKKNIYHLHMTIQCRIYIFLGIGCIKKFATIIQEKRHYKNIHQTPVCCHGVAKGRAHAVVLV